MQHLEELDLEDLEERTSVVLATLRRGSKHVLTLTRAQHTGSFRRVRLCYKGGRLRLSQARSDGLHRQLSSCEFTFTRNVRRITTSVWRRRSCWSALGCARSNNSSGYLIPDIQILDSLLMEIINLRSCLN